MNLILPTIAVDSGLTWEQAINANSSILDTHNHAAGSGVPINPSGMNINLDLPFNGNNATTLRSVRFTAQVSPLATPTDLGCLYVSGADLYYNDENGNQIQITSGGTVNATSSGISSGTATASFSGSTLVVNSASNTPANVQCASILLGNTGTTNSKYVTISPVNPLAANYAITLPLAPASQKIMTMDASGVITAPYSVDNSTIEISTNTIQVKDQGITQAKKAIRTTGTTVGVGGVAVSNPGSGSFAYNQTSFLSTGISCTLTTLGNPIFIWVTAVAEDGNYGNTGFGASSGQVFTWSIYNGTSHIAFGSGGIGGSGSVACIANADIHTIDIKSAGTYTYTIYVRTVSSSNTGPINYGSLVISAYEL